PNFRFHSGQTIFEGVGGPRLTLPSGWVADTTTAGMTRLEASLKPVEIASARRRAAVGVDQELGRRCGRPSRYRDETKEGIPTVGAVIGNSGGTPRSVILPEPIAYATQQLDVVLGYADPRKQ